MSDRDAHQREIRSGKRFEFGKNWKRFLQAVDDDTIAEARLSLSNMLEQDDLSGLRFLDVGSGSGLFSLAARRLGASVHSFDYDPQSVKCTRELKRLYCPEDPQWTIAEGSVLDPGYLQSLGSFDIIYAWGVLHHTGSMWQALDNLAGLVPKGGRLFLALYNDQGWRSAFWRRVKQTYCRSRPGKLLVCAAFLPVFALAGAAQDLAGGRNPFRLKRSRGMSRSRDWFDWLGGLPFEVAKPEEVVDFCSRRGLYVLKLDRTRGLGNNQFVFIRS